MERKDMHVGMRVRPSGKGVTKDWNLSAYEGTILRIGRNFITVAWDGFAELSVGLRAMHLEPLDEDGCK